MCDLVPPDHECVSISSVHLLCRWPCDDVKVVSCCVWCFSAEDVVFPIGRVSCVEPTLPMDFKKKMFGAAPKPDRTVCLKDGGV